MKHNRIVLAEKQSRYIHSRCSNPGLIISLKKSKLSCFSIMVKARLQKMQPNGTKRSMSVEYYSIKEQYAPVFVLTIANYKLHVPLARQLKSISNYY